MTGSKSKRRVPPPISFRESEEKPGRITTDIKFQDHPTCSKPCDEFRADYTLCKILGKLEYHVVAASAGFIEMGLSTRARPFARRLNRETHALRESRYLGIPRGIPLRLSCLGIGSVVRRGRGAGSTLGRGARSGARTCFLSIVFDR